MFGMPGIPCVYYGSEWGEKADKSQGDQALRPSFEQPIENELFKHISKLADIKKNSTALNYGDFSTILLTNKQCVIKRCVDTETVLVCINADENKKVYAFFVSKFCSILIIGILVYLIGKDTLNDMMSTLSSGFYSAF